MYALNMIVLQYFPLNSLMKNTAIKCIHPEQRSKKCRAWSDSEESAADLLSDCNGTLLALLRLTAHAQFLTTVEFSSSPENTFI